MAAVGGTEQQWCRLRVKVCSSSWKQSSEQERTSKESDHPTWHDSPPAYPCPLAEDIRVEQPVSRLLKHLLQTYWGLGSPGTSTENHTEEGEVTLPPGGAYLRGSRPWVTPGALP